jgi:hypothetical protein
MNMRTPVTRVAALVCLLLAIVAAKFVSPANGAPGSQTRSGSSRFNGFDVSNAIIPPSKILSGGQPRDGIPAIDRPKFISPARVNFLQPNDLVVSVTIQGETRAYPLRILVWHEIANDTIAGVPVAVTYCPLCGTAMVFNRNVNGSVLSFGVSGLLYESDVLMYDRQTDSLWSQLGMRAVSGRLAQTPLEWLASEHLTWAAWKQKYPEGKVLSTDTGHRRNYAALPYRGYEQSPGTMFPVSRHREDLPQKEWVLGVIINDEAKAYRLDALPPNQTIQDSVGAVPIGVIYDPATRHPRVFDLNTGEPIPYVQAYWFAWQAFYPQTSLWKP